MEPKTIELEGPAASPLVILPIMSASFIGTLVYIAKFGLNYAYISLSLLCLIPIYYYIKFSKVSWSLQLTPTQLIIERKSPIVPRVFSTPWSDVASLEVKVHSRDNIGAYYELKLKGPQIVRFGYLSSEQATAIQSQIEDYRKSLSL